MKRYRILIALLNCLLLSLLFVSCSSNKSKLTSGSGTSLTIEDVKKKYPSSEIKNVYQINDKNVMIETQKDTFANRFEIYNLSTGQVDILPTSNEFVTLDKIIDENTIIFLSSGKNSESPITKFPYVLKCIRVYNTKDEGNFIALSEEKTFKLNEPTHSGSKKDCQLSDVIFTFNGCQLLFKPTPGNEAAFFADSIDIPPTKTKYIQEKNQIVIELDKVSLTENTAKNRSISCKNNPYVSSIEINSVTNTLEVLINLNDSAKEYKINSHVLPINGAAYPYLEIEFASTK